MSDTTITPPTADWMERALLQRYLERTLSAQEIEWFEAYMLDKPQLITEIEADTDLRDALALAAVSEPAVAAPSRSAPGLRRIGKPRWPSLAWAASVVVALSLGLMLGGPLAIRAGGSDALIASPERVVFDTLRGAEASPLVYPGAADSRHVLVEVGLPLDAEQITLHLEGLAPQSLVLSPDGFASFVIPRVRLGAEPAPRIEYSRGGARVSRTLAFSGNP